MKIQDAEKYIQDYVRENGLINTIKDLLFFAQKNESHNTATCYLDRYSLHIDFKWAMVYIIDNLEPDSEEITDFKAGINIPDIFYIFMAI